MCVAEQKCIGFIFRAHCFDRFDQKLDVLCTGFNDALLGYGCHFRAVINAHDSSVGADLPGQFQECCTGAAGNVEDGLPRLQCEGIHGGGTNVPDPPATGIIT